MDDATKKKIEAALAKGDLNAVVAISSAAHVTATAAAAEDANTDAPTPLPRILAPNQRIGAPEPFQPPAEA